VEASGQLPSLPPPFKSGPSAQGHMAQLMPLTVSCFSKIQIGFTFLVHAHPDRPGKRAVKCTYVLA